MTITKELCQQLAHYVYGGDTLEGYFATQLPQYERAKVGLITNNKGYFKDVTTGCAAAFYYNKDTNEGVISYRGTERPGLGELWSVSLPDLKDWKADLSLMINKVPDQFNSAFYFYKEVVKAYPDVQLGFTGHSLGGALASLVAVKAGSYPTFTFNAPGVRHLLNNPSIGLPLNGNYNAITNFSVMNDWCGMVNAHIGNLYVLPPQPMRKLNSPNDFAGMAPFIDTHEWILNANLNKAFPKPVGFNESEALSLWYYDVNNSFREHVAGSLPFDVKALLKALTSRISQNSLLNAINILRSDSKYVEHIFRYSNNDLHISISSSLGKVYVVGFPEKENIIIGSIDNEIIYGGNKIDSMSGGAGNDELHGFEGNDTIRGGSGNDILYGNEGNDILYGDEGNDVLYGNEGNDTLYGGSGRDTLYGGSGQDYLSGGSGIDFYILEKYSNDIIGDSDGRGVIKYDGKFLNGSAQKIQGQENKWQGAYGIIYEYIAPNLIVDNSFTILQFKNGNLGITLLKEDGTPEPTIPGSSGSSGEGGEGGSGSGSGSGGSGSGGGEGSTSGGTGESNYDHDDEGNLITGGGSSSDDYDTYEIMEGDTIWGILAALGLDPNDYEELIRLNPWLADRFSDDMKKCLIFPGEILILPKGKGAVKFEKDGEHQSIQPKPITTPDKDISNAGPANVPPVDPLIFDLDFNNIISLSKPENGRNFDIDNDGIAQKVAWINSGDAILVCDRNNNGTIDNGLELFGDNTLLENGEYAKSGIEALAEFDTNKDGKITLADLKFSDLKLLKSDNTTITLEEAGIKEISLSYTVVNKTDKNGNRQIKEAKFITNDDVEHIYGEFMLNQNIYQSVSAEIIEESEEVAALPDVSGSGLVHSLHQSIMRDVSGNILTAFNSFLNEENLETKHQLCEQLIYKWAGTENVSTTSRGTLFDGRKLATIEAFAGTYLQGSQKTRVINQNAANILKNGFNNFIGFVYSSLATQTHMSELFLSLDYKHNTSGWKINFNNTFKILDAISVKIVLTTTTAAELAIELLYCFLNISFNEPEIIICTVILKNLFIPLSLASFSASFLVLPFLTEELNSSFILNHMPVSVPKVCAITAILELSPLDDVTSLLAFSIILLTYSPKSFASFSSSPPDFSSNSRKRLYKFCIP